MPTYSQSPVTYQYAYDSAGRLTEAVDSSGIALIYTYDAAGNLLSITKQVGVFTAIFGANGANGSAINAAKVGQQVTLTGIGLGDCPDVTVTVDGITATIVSKTTNTITIIIPEGATNGVIVVNTCHGSGTITLPIGDVTVTPPTAMLMPGQTAQFTATTLPSTLNQSVIWSIDGEITTELGTISATGLYTAPTAAVGTVTVRATSVLYPDLSGTAQVTVLAPAYVLSPGVSVQITAASSGPAAPTPVYVISPGVSVVFGSAGGGGVLTLPYDVLSPGVSVQFGGTSGTGNGTPVYVLSPGVSVLVAPQAGVTSPVPIYALSPGVSVLVTPPTAVGSYTASIFALSPGVSVFNGSEAGGGGQNGAMPVFGLSPGVSVQNGPEVVGGGTDDNGTLFILSPGVSVAPVATTGRALTPAAGHARRVTSQPPTRINPGRSGVMTVTGAHMEDSTALGFLDDAGRLDPDIAIQSAVITNNGRTMTLRLAVQPKAKLGRRRLVVWKRPAPTVGPAPRVHFLR